MSRSELAALRVGGEDVEESSVCFVQMCVPAYREPLFDLIESRNPGWTVLAGPDYLSPSITTRNPARVRLRNHYLANRRLAWQSGALRLAARADVAIVELNPRILSAWPILLVRRALRRPTVLWGHATGLGESGRGARAIRHGLLRLADGFVAYTDAERERARPLMAARGVRVTAPNGLYARGGPAPGDEPGRLFVYVGRLTDDKDVPLLLEAFATARRDLSEHRLRIVGGGPARDALMARAAELGIDEAVEFRSETWGEAGVATAYVGAVAAVSPGYAGLIVTQAHWFGRPIVFTSAAENAPEVDGTIPGLDVDFGGAEGLAAALVEVAGRAETDRGRRRDVAEATRATFSLDGMAEAFEEVVRAVRTRGR